MPKDSPSSRWFQWTFGFGLWTLIGLSFASQFYFSSSKFGNPVSWSTALLWALGDWYVFALLSIPALWLARHYPVGPPFRLGSVLLHLGASGVFSLLWMVLRAALGQLQSQAQGEGVSFEAAFQPLLAKTFHFNLLVYWVVVSITNGFSYYQRFQEREIRNAELEKRLAEAKLQALQMQLNPHFLFNTLHAISALMHRDVEAADRMLTRLSELLRVALEATDTQEVPLRDEIRFLQRYLEIEETRFGDRLQVQWAMNPDTLDAMVPNLLLQPIVENAIRHGIEPHGKPGKILLSAQRTRHSLRLEVSDNGGGIAGTIEEGVGLSNTRARLNHLYGANHQFRLENRSQGGCLVSIDIPFRLPSNSESFKRAEDVYENPYSGRR